MEPAIFYIHFNVRSLFQLIKNIANYFPNHESARNTDRTPTGTHAHGSPNKRQSQPCETGSSDDDIVIFHDLLPIDGTFFKPLPHAGVLLQPGSRGACPEPRL